MLKERPPPSQYQYMKLIQYSANINLLCVLVGVFQLSDHKIHMVCFTYITIQITSKIRLRTPNLKCVLLYVDA